VLTLDQKVSKRQVPKKQSSFSSSYPSVLKAVSFFFIKNNNNNNSDLCITLRNN